MKREHLAWLPAILIMIMIFIYSSMPATESTEKSIKVTEIVVHVYERISNKPLEEHERASQIEALDHFVRKGAHITEYALLAAAMAFALGRRGNRGFSLFLQSVILTASYAATDEFHQRFVPGRSGELRDVLIDSIGAVLGALVYLAVARVVQQKRISKESFNYKS